MNTTIIMITQIQYGLDKKGKESREGLPQQQPGI